MQEVDILELSSQLISFAFLSAGWCYQRALNVLLMPHPQSFIVGLGLSKIMYWILIHTVVLGVRDLKTHERDL